MACTLGVAYDSPILIASHDSVHSARAYPSSGLLTTHRPSVKATTETHSETRHNAVVSPRKHCFSRCSATLMPTATALGMKSTLDFMVVSAVLDEYALMPAPMALAKCRKHFSNEWYRLQPCKSSMRDMEPVKTLRPFAPSLQ